MNIKTIFIITFITYYLIATFIILNIALNPRWQLKLINKKTGETKEPSTFFIIFFCLLWIIFIPLSINNEGDE